MMVIKKGDFIELDFVGKIKETDQIFDLTDESLAKKNNIHNPHIKYGPKIICVGERHIVKGLDEFLIGKDTKNYTVELSPENAFGKKDARLMKIVSSSSFKKQKIQPFPGLQLNIDGRLGIVRTVSGGRIIVDFNHPLAGRNLVYEITVKRIVKDTKEKLDGLLVNMFNKEIKFSIKEGKASVEMEVPKPIEDTLIKKIKDLIPELKKVGFIDTKQDKKDTTTKE